ncbi:hypothetical protein B6U84_01550 [Candidatus Bathyarchaeota archaeon ex4484_40]|nr:MAG: hypothetical protein B6U84_01550 [Candidatus Bathyarchaeota archaeon ex4484_40]
MGRRHGTGEKIREGRAFYDLHAFCSNCQSYVDKKYRRCPNCGRLLRFRPRSRRWARWRRKHYDLDEALEVFNRFLARGYDVEEAVTFTESITGIRVNPFNLDLPKLRKEVEIHA